MQRNLSRIAVFTFLAALLHGTPARCQDSLAVGRGLLDYPDSVFVVADIFVIGNTETKDFVIKREMSLSPGDFVTKKMVEYDENRIYSLGLFNEIKIRVIPHQDNTATLVVGVS
jgi:hypothetical protein